MTSWYIDKLSFSSKFSLLHFNKHLTVSQNTGLLLWVCHAQLPFITLGLIHKCFQLIAFIGIENLLVIKHGILEKSSVICLSIPAHLSDIDLQNLIS